MSSKWTNELRNALQNESVEDDTIIPLVTIWLVVIIFNLSQVHSVSLTRTLLLAQSDIIMKKPLTMTRHNQTLGTNAIKKSKELSFSCLVLQ